MDFLDHFPDSFLDKIFILQTKAEVVDVTDQYVIIVLPLDKHVVPTRQKKKAALLRARPVEGTY